MNTIQSLVYYILVAACSTVIYVLLFIFIHNRDLITQSLIQDFPLQTKMQIIYLLIEGMPSTMPLLNFLTIMCIAALTGINISLLTKTITRLRSFGKMNVVVGGGSILGLVSTGCASCGLPLLALFGVGSSISMLPLQGYEFSLFTILVLLFSTYVLLKKVRSREQCAVPQQT